MVLQATISEVASISDKEVVSKFFKRTMKRLLNVTRVAGKAEYARKSSAMQIDDSSDERSASVMRLFIFPSYCCAFGTLCGSSLVCFAHF